MEEDEDVIIEGSELHTHLVSNGYEDVETRSPTKHPEGFNKEITEISEEAKKLEESSKTSTLSEGKRLLTAAVWSDSVNKLLEVELAQEILKSELLVTEDEDFINNFILSEDVLENYKLEKEGGSRSYLGEVLMISGSLAAVAGAVFFLSERTRAAAAAAAILPSALAAISSARVGAKVQSNAEAEQFKELLKYMIQNMKTFKQLLRKSLNLIQGMEMMNQGYLMASGYHGSNQHNEATNQSDEVVAECDDDNKLSKALCKRSSFIALRRAIYSCTVQMILVYRESVEFLMEVSPLAEHIDLKDHYLAFIGLDTFGLVADPPDSRLSVRQLKDTIQLNLLQQSEYLRRFSLAFCDKVREDEGLNKSGILKHVKDTVTKIRRVTEKLAKVFEYHQALGLLPVPELEQRALTLRKQQSIDMVKKLLPLRNVYTSLFSTGLHLQNSLLKVRHLESFFDVLDKYKASQDQGGAGGSSNQLPTEEKLLEWLKGFKDIQGELNACLTCLDDGVGQIDDLKRPPSSRSNGSDVLTSPDPTSSIESLAGSHQSQRVISESDEPSNMDEVFEAFIDCDTQYKLQDDHGTEEGGEGDQMLKKKEHKQQSQKVLRELKSVLVVKEQEFQLREAKAIARQARVNSIDVGSSIEASVVKDPNSAATSCSSSIANSPLTALPISSIDSSSLLDGHRSSSPSTINSSLLAGPSISSTSQSSLLAASNTLLNRPTSLSDDPNSTLASHKSLSGGSKRPSSLLDGPNSSLANPSFVSRAEVSLPSASILYSSIPSSSSIETFNMSQAVPISSTAKASTSKAQSIASVDSSIEVASQSVNGARRKCPKDASHKSKLNGSSQKTDDIIYKDCSSHTKDNKKQESSFVLKEKAKTNNVACVKNGDSVKESILRDLPTYNSTSQPLLSRLGSMESAAVPLHLKIDALSAEMELDQLSASSDLLQDSFYMRSTIEREINNQATSDDINNSPTKETKQPLSLISGCDSKLTITSDAIIKDNSIDDNNPSSDASIDPHNADNNPTSDSSKTIETIDNAFSKVTDNLSCNLTNTKYNPFDNLDTGDAGEDRVDPKVNEDNKKESEKVKDNFNGHNAEFEADLKGHDVVIEDDLNGHGVEVDNDLMDHRVEVKDDFKDDLNGHTNMEEVCKSFGDDFVPRKVDIQPTQNVDVEVEEHTLNGHYLDDSNDTDSDKNTEQKPFGSLVDDQQLLEEFEELNIKNGSSSSRLEVPVPSLVKTSILGLSQETDSECDSFRSDTNTVKSQDTDPGHYSDSILQSSRTQDTLESTPDSSDCDPLEQKILNFKRNKLRSLPQMSHSVQPTSVSSETKNLIENRSLSTPDLKRIAGCDISSPYVSLEKLPDQRRGQRGHVREDSSSSTSSSDENEPGSSQSFSRPRRPGKKRPYQRRRKSNTESQMKPIREHNPQSTSTSSTEIRLGEEPSVARNPESIQDKIAGIPANHNSVYMQKHRGEDLSYNTQPSGFTASLAAEAAARSRLLRKGFTNTVGSWGFKGLGKEIKEKVANNQEEIFGSDSD